LIYVTDDTVNLSFSNLKSQRINIFGINLAKVSVLIVTFLTKKILNFREIATEVI